MNRQQRRALRESRIDQAADGPVHAFADAHHAGVREKLATYLDAHPGHTGDLGALVAWNDATLSAIVEVAPLARIVRVWSSALASSADPIIAARILTALQDRLPPSAPGTFRVRVVVATPTNEFAVRVHAAGRRTVRPAHGPDVVERGDGLMLNSVGLSKLLLIVARTEPEPMRGNARRILATLLEVPGFDRVEALAASLGDGHVIDAATAALDARPDLARAAGLGAPFAGAAS